MSELGFKFTRLTPEPKVLSHALLTPGPIMQHAYTAEPSKKAFTWLTRRNYPASLGSQGALTTLLGSPNSLTSKGQKPHPQLAIYSSVSCTENAEK